MPAAANDLFVINDEASHAGDQQNMVFIRTLIGHQYFKNVQEVRDRLPELLGRLLAVCWIDKDFQARFMNDPQKTISTLNIQLPENIFIEKQLEKNARPAVLVYEKTPPSRYKQKLFSLSLKLMANR